MGCECWSWRWWRWVHIQFRVLPRLRCRRELPKRLREALIPKVLDGTLVLILWWWLPMRSTLYISRFRISEGRRGSSLLQTESPRGTSRKKAEMKNLFFFLLTVCPFLYHIYCRIWIILSRKNTKKRNNLSLANCRFIYENRRRLPLQKTTCSLLWKTFLINYLQYWTRESYQSSILWEKVSKFRKTRVRTFS